MPEDVQTEAYEYPEHSLRKGCTASHARCRRKSELAAAELIGQAKRPLIVAGGGVIYSEASDALDRLADLCGIPSVRHRRAKGPSLESSVARRARRGERRTAANRLAAKADLVIAVGTRLSDFTTASRTAFAHPDVRFVGLNVTAMDAFKFGALTARRRRP